MVDVLSAPQLYTHIGGAAPTLDELELRYRQLQQGSPEPDRQWLNWVIRRQSDLQAVGTMQATLSVWELTRTSADLAWVVGTPWQGHGFATEAAGRVMAALRMVCVARVTASIHPLNYASQAVARRLGLRPAQTIGDEIEWVTYWDAPSRVSTPGAA
jgi:RimJ/RimL family protein N-acetyltransferase